tara:strand:- start:129 stop:281 length:153 start_codon:yes stop_codon:yes gene_type:complete
MPMVKITKVVYEKDMMNPSKEIIFSLKSLARSYNSMHSKSMNKSINWIDN